MPAVSLDFLSWQPCILKQGPLYNDPWRYNCNDANSLKEIRKPHASVAKRKPILVYDSKKLDIKDYVSLNEAARALCVVSGQIMQSAKKGWLIDKRFVCGYTIQELTDNMKKYGWD